MEQREMPSGVVALWKVSEVAERARVTVRTLHHYDEIGLLVPSERSDAGYRLYAEADLERLYQILLYKKLGFPLDTIAQAINDQTMDLRAALREQRELLLEKQRQVDAVIRALDRTLQHMEEGTKMTHDEMIEGFDAFAEAPEEIRAHQAKYADETRERWGDTDAYKESMRRTKKLRKEDWERMQQEAGAAEARMAELLAAGADPEGEDAMAGAEAMRQHIDTWFYSCSPEMHAGLADMYEADPRFTAHYEDRAPGLATFVARAIRANSRKRSA
jgi:MerR family transcriptional regulator, thiopeptide resistance regulator